MDVTFFEQALQREIRPGSFTVEIGDSKLPVAPQPLEWWKREPGAEPPVGSDVLDWVRDGYVLDIGCATGRDLEILAARGVAGHGIELIPAAVAMAKDAGVSCVRADVFSYTPPRPVDTVLAVGGNGGMAARLAALPEFLLRLSSWLNETGRIVFTSTDWRKLPPGTFNTRELPDGGYRGDIRMRLWLEGEAGPWFPWLFVDPDALEKACSEAGLRITARKEWQGGIAYAALLERAVSA
ncbi:MULTISPECIES: class I SAM-dependent methyltransferase [Amycolatopsis]|uniref:Class I SAM-dependent methyltransferase n=1 Tax=Amycolatopsis albidoflavus TaxID=102226 RepID=A0ABW5I6L0_9PSEU